MKVRNGIAALLPVVLAASSAAAQPLADALAGKTCQGTFNSGREREASAGALQLQFAMSGGRLTAQFRQAVGQRLAQDRGIIVIGVLESVGDRVFADPRRHHEAADIVRDARRRRRDEIGQGGVEAAFALLQLLAGRDAEARPVRPPDKAAGGRAIPGQRNPTP